MYWQKCWNSMQFPLHKWDRVTPFLIGLTIRNKLIRWLTLLLQQLDKNLQKRIFWCLCLSSPVLSHLPALPLKSRSKLQSKRVLSAFWAIRLSFFTRIFSCQAKRLWRTDDIMSCWTLPPLWKVCQASLSVSFCPSPTSPQFFHSLSLSVDQDTGRLGSDSQGFICKGESITWWQCMFSHLLKLHTGEHKHMSIKATAGG